MYKKNIKSDTALENMQQLLSNTETCMEEQSNGSLKEPKSVCGLFLQNLFKKMIDPRKEKGKL